MTHAEPAPFLLSVDTGRVPWSRGCIGQARMPHQSSGASLECGGVELCCVSTRRSGCTHPQPVHMQVTYQRIISAGGSSSSSSHLRCCQDGGLPPSRCDSHSCISPADLQGHLLNTAGCNAWCCIAWVWLLTDPAGQRDMSACASNLRLCCCRTTQHILSAPSQALRATVALCMRRLEGLYTPAWLLALVGVIACAQA